jgi:hypothetical protein
MSPDRLRTAEVQSVPEPEPPPWERLSELEEYETLCRMRLEHSVEVREPLVLVSQIQRSGGTLLAQLLDGHAECHTDPYELKIGFPKKWDWPPVDLSRPETWFETLVYSRIDERVQRVRPKRPGRGRSIFPFLFLPRVQKAVFDAYVETVQPETEREVLDCYFTSYFNAWLDNHNLYTGPKRVVTGFVPRLVMDARNVSRFFSAYPDGTLISIVRDPRAWYLSAAGHDSSYADLEAAIGLWRQSARAALDALDRYGERVVVLTYEQLVMDSEATMRLVSERIGITMSPVLLEPTFNRQPIRANSSASIDRYGILPDRVDAYRDSLDRATIARIDELAGDGYELAAAAAGAARPARLRA